MIESVDEMFRSSLDNISISESHESMKGGFSLYLHKIKGINED